MAIINKIGLEAEFLLRNAKDELIIPPSYWDRDGFPLLGEIRGEESEEAGVTVANFMKKKMEIIGKLRKGHTIDFAAVERCPLALYRKANKEADLQEKHNQMGKVLNSRGIDIEDFSDQIIAKGKIQGIRISCGLHVHFSSEEYDEHKYEEEQYELVNIPLGINFSSGSPSKAKEAAFEEIVRPEIRLYRHRGWKKKCTLKCRASRLNKPAIYYIVNEMDKAFFDRFAPAEKDRTKFRQPGFFELKPYGFEYRSLPMTDVVEKDLFEIATTAMKLLKEINEY